MSEVPVVAQQLSVTSDAANEPTGVLFGTDNGLDFVGKGCIMKLQHR